jgi:hypothetical protein
MKKKKKLVFSFEILKNSHFYPKSATSGVRTGILTSPSNLPWALSYLNDRNIFIIPYSPLWHLGHFSTLTLLGEKLSGYKSSKSVLVPGSNLRLLGITISWICNFTRTTQELENSQAAWESGYSLANFPSQREGSPCSGKN